MLLQENSVVAERFRLVRKIGQGGMGSVWQAVHLALDQPCAVKFIDGEFTNVNDAHARFEREAKAAAQLRSPHVVQILDHGVWQGRPYIAMELLEGEDLGKTLARAGGKLPPALINTISQQVCRALTKAHQAGVVHRDLKPDNIFLVTDDDRQIVKILDFGVAKQTSHGIDGANTKTGAMLGTPYYMSPEQAQGIKSVDSRSDLWALAVIVYQCLTGQRPFDSDALGDLLVKIIVQPVPVPSQIASVPPEFDRWWAKAAERDPDRRFQTAKEFTTALSVALGVTADGTEHVRLAPAQPGLRGTAMMQPSAMPQSVPPAHATNMNANANADAGLAVNAAAAPQAQQRQTTALVATPQSSNATPDGMAMGRYPSGPPQRPSLGGTGNPITFSGVEPPIAIPKRPLPPVVLAGMGAVLLVGLGLTAVVVARRASSTSTSTSTSTLSAAASGELPRAATSASTSTLSAAASGELPRAATSAATPLASEVAPASTITTTRDPPSVASTEPPKKAAPATAPVTHSDPKIVAVPGATPAGTAGTAVSIKPAASVSVRRPSMDDRKW